MSSLEWGGPGEDAEGRHSVASPADLCGVGCASGDDCPFAHGLADLRLPSATEQEQALQVRWAVYVSGMRAVLPCRKQG